MNQLIRNHHRHTRIALALALSLGASSASSAPNLYQFSGTMNFYDATGVLGFTDTTVTGNFDLAGGLPGISPYGSFVTTTPFFGFLWTADVDQVFFADTNFDGVADNLGPQTWTWTNYTFFSGGVINCKVGVNIDGCLLDYGIDVNNPGDALLLGSATNSYSFSFTNAGHMTAGTFFDWSVNQDIAVLAMFQASPTADGFDVTSVDSDDDGTPGTAMNNGPFVNQTPAFSGSMTAVTCTYTVTSPPDLTDKAVTDTSTVTINIGTATVTDVNTGTVLPASAILLPDTSLEPNSDVDFTTGVSTILWDKLDTTETDCEDTQVVTVHEWTPPADIVIAASTPATGIDLGTPTDLGGALNPNGVPLVFTNDAPADGFGPGTTVVTWTATDDFGGSTTDTQNVTINLPDGIIGGDCTVDLATAGDRLVDGVFTMRDPTGAITGSIDYTVTGTIDTTKICLDEACVVSGASLDTSQPFFGEFWKATPIRLFDVGTWTFEACPGDNSTFCSTPPPPRPLSMTVLDATQNNGVTQLGAHMLFEWSVNQDIDVVVVWDVDCGSNMLTSTDPDGDGIIGTKMVDGPFIGFNAAFDLTTQPGEPPIAQGGYEVSIPVYQNPVAGGSPLELNPIVLQEADLPPDAAAVNSCILGGCFSFQVEGVTPLSSLNVVLPLTGPIPYYTVYRQYINGAWKTFTVNSKNSVKSAPTNPETGYCPEPGSTNYQTAPSNSVMANMLNPGDECIQLTIEDNGPNDSEPAAGTIADPSGVAQFPTPKLPSASTSGGGCSIGNTEAAPINHGEWWLLTGLLTLLGWRCHSHRQH